jgi:hypothetical protein
MFYFEVQFSCLPPNGSVFPGYVSSVTAGWPWMIFLISSSVSLSNGVPLRGFVPLSENVLSDLTACNMFPVFEMVFSVSLHNEKFVL